MARMRGMARFGAVAVGAAVVVALFHGAAFAQGKATAPNTTADKSALTPPEPARPVVDAAIADYVRTVDVDGSVRSIGSSTLSNLLNRWVRDFKLLHPQVQIDVVGGGSGIAMPALMEGKSDLAPMSRPMNRDEIAVFEKKFGYPPTRVTVALDAIAIYVHKDNPIERVTLAQLDSIFSVTRRRGGAEMRRWGQLGATGEWQDMPITIKSPASTHGMHGLFRELVLNGGDYRMDLRAEPVSTSIVQGVGAERGAIGFASYFYATQRTHLLAVAAKEGGPFVAPTQADAASGRYPLTRFLSIYVNKKPGEPLAGATRALLTFICSRQGQEVVARDGNYPLSAEIAARECAKQLD